MKSLDDATKIADQYKERLSGPDGQSNTLGLLGGGGWSLAQALLIVVREQQTKLDELKTQVDQLRSKLTN